MFTGRKTKLKDKLKKLLKQTKPANMDFIIIELKMLKNPPRFFDKTLKYKQKNYMFDILDLIGRKKFTSTPSLIKQADIAYELLLFMIIKRLQDLVIWKSPRQTAKGFYQQKLKSQAGNYTIPEILEFHQKLLDFDLNYKTGKTKYKDPKLALNLFLFSLKEVGYDY
ncbi:MAG: hypothetical protein GXP43_02820 [bacterium]|nr:hypothetical protein [bacterium]